MDSAPLQPFQSSVGLDHTPTRHVHRHLYSVCCGVPTQCRENGDRHETGYPRNSSEEQQTDRADWRRSVGCYRPYR